MYSGTTFRKGSGRIVGVHQKVDRAARRCLREIINDNEKFPDIKGILHFEGKNGPDGIKSKSSGKDEPWHFINPKDPNDFELANQIDDHIHNLSTALRVDNNVRAAFEAAWLAHAITDGLTPAHHFDLDKKIEELWGMPRQDRKTLKQKNIITGKNRRDTISKNWQYWGTKGVFTAHLGFEMGVASAIAAERYQECDFDFKSFGFEPKNGFIPYFLKSVSEIDQRKIYEKYHEKGWTIELAKEVKEELMPMIIRNIVTAWYYAYLESQKK